MTKKDIISMPPYFDQYINLVEDSDVIEALQKYNVDYVTAEMPTLKLLGDKIYAPHKWTVNDILQHVVDNERIFSYRALRFARQDKTPLPGVDENAHAANAKANGRRLEDIISEFDNCRQATVALYKSFDKDQMLSEGIAFNKNISVLAIGYLLSGHLIHHMNVIKERYYPLLNM